MAAFRREHQLTGRYGSYTLRTIADCDKQITALTAVIRATRGDAAKLDRLRHDRDLILERRLALAVS